MNFDFRMDDIVEFRRDTKHPVGRLALGVEFTIVKEFPLPGLGPMKLFKIRSTEYDARVYSKDLIRVRRPSDAVQSKAVKERKVVAKMARDAKASRIERLKEEFAPMAELKIPLTADGLPDKRYKPRYSAKNSPVVIKAGKRSRLI